MINRLLISILLMIAISTPVYADCLHVANTVGIGTAQTLDIFSTHTCLTIPSCTENDPFALGCTKDNHLGTELSCGISANRTIDEIETFGGYHSLPKHSGKRNTLCIVSWIFAGLYGGSMNIHNVANEHAAKTGVGGGPLAPLSITSHRVPFEAGIGTRL